MITLSASQYYIYNTDSKIVGALCETENTECKIKSTESRTDKLFEVTDKLVWQI